MSVSLAIYATFVTLAFAAAMLLKGPARTYYLLIKRPKEAAFLCGPYYSAAYRDKVLKDYAEDKEDYVVLYTLDVRGARASIKQVGHTPPGSAAMEATWKPNNERGSRFDNL